MKKNIQLLLAMLALTGASFAQTQTAPAQADAAKLALAREVIAAVQADKMIDSMLAQLKQMAAQTAAVPADATPEQRQKAEALQAEILTLSMKAARGLINQMDQVYADVYSEAELQAMKAFFGSPEGRSMIAKQPQIMARIMPLAQKMQQDLMPQIQQLVQAAQAK